MFVARRRISSVLYQRHIRYGPITYDGEKKFSQSSPAGRAGGSSTSTRNATPDRPRVVGTRADANFVRRWRVFSASTTRPARVGPYARGVGPTRSSDFHGADAIPATENGVPCARRSLRTFIYLFSTNETRGELLPSENFRVNKTTLTNTDPPFINCTDRAPNGAARLAETSRSSRRERRAESAGHAGVATSLPPRAPRR